MAEGGAGSNDGTALTHAADRALEHHGLHLRPEDERAIAWRIKSGHAVLMGKFPHGGVERWLVEIRGKTLKVIFNPVCGKIVTIEPNSAKPRFHYVRKIKHARRRKGRR
ncbi:hypothetical protein LCGC14_1690820 [marine sediment metagenome]|uniref:DUF4258 domain-containing protein n=1 Tax=marine sediment metagenome TaxID=412755 RepID=A0A0F9K1A9_9ZZZZ